MEQLYTCGDSNEVHMLQLELQALQKSPQGYNLASYLLQHPSRNCQYFGALTLAVVIQAPDLTSEASQAILQLIHLHISRLAQDLSLLQPNLFIMRKLMSNLSLMYLKEQSVIPNPVLVLLRALGMPEGADSASMRSYLPEVPPMTIALVLLFLSILVGDVLKLASSKTALHMRIHTEIFPFMVVLFEYLNYLKQLDRLQRTLSVSALETLNSWMSYLPNINGDARYDADLISIFVEFLFLYLESNVDPENQDSLSECQMVLNIFLELLEVNPLLLSIEIKLKLYSLIFEHDKWGVQFMDKVIFTDRREEYQEEVNSFVDLVITILQLNVIRLSKSILDSSTQRILSIAYRLTAVPGTPYIEDFISERMLVFWEEFASAYEDSADLLVELFAVKSDPSFEQQFENERKRIFNEVAKVYWAKLRMSEAETFESIRAEFNSYRSSVADFFLVAYSLLKTEFYSTLTSSLIETTKSCQNNSMLIVDIEATLYLLFNINEDTAYYESQMEALAPFSLSIFESGIIATFKQLPLDNFMNQRFYSTFIQYLALNEFFFKRPEGSVFLGQVFDLLFPFLMSDFSNLSLLASKTATKLCEACSHNLVGFLPNLEIIVIEMLRNPSIDSLIRLRMFSAYSSIARRVDNVEEHSRIINGMISTIAEAGSLMMDAKSTSLNDVEEDYLVSLLSCLVNVGKGSSLTDEDIDELLEEQQEAYKSYWLKDPLNTKQLILSIVENYSLRYPFLAQKTIIIEKCTMVFRVGLGEKLGGPFDFGVETIARYAISVMESITNANGVPYVFELIECVISVNYRELTPTIVEELMNRLFTLKLAFLKTDPDMIKSAINVFSKMIEVKPSLVIHSEIFTTTVIGFAIGGLEANEAFIIKSVLKFWCNILNMKRGSKEDQDRILQLFCNQKLGKHVTFSLVTSFLKAPRSNLEYYYSVFRGLVGKFPIPFKEWFQQTLREIPDIITPRMSEKDLDLFVHKLMITRGRRTANEVLKSLWLTVNGLVEYNTQSY